MQETQYATEYRVKASLKNEFSIQFHENVVMLNTIILNIDLDVRGLPNTGKIPFTTEEIECAFSEEYDFTWERHSHWKYEWRFSFNGEHCLIRNVEGSNPLEWEFVGNIRDEIVKWLSNGGYTTDTIVTTSKHFGEPPWCVYDCKCSDNPNRSHCSEVYEKYICTHPEYLKRGKLADF